MSVPAKLGRARRVGLFVVGLVLAWALLPRALMGKRADAWFDWHTSVVFRAVGRTT